MKRFTIPSILLLSVFAVTFSCCRPEENIVAGKGGNATLKVIPQHHGRNIDSCTIFIKYNVQDMPTNGYDEEVICVQENGNPVGTFSGLKKGDYYVYGRGWDPDIEQVVIGGTPYKITEETTININIPVTEEGH